MTKNPRIRQPIPVISSPIDEKFDEAALENGAGETGPPCEDTTLRIHPPFAVRAGDLLQVADTARIALSIADTATDFLEQGGNMPKTVASLRAQIAALRGLR